MSGKNEQENKTLSLDTVTKRMLAEMAAEDHLTDSAENRMIIAQEYRRRHPDKAFYSVDRAEPVGVIPDSGE